MQLQANRDDYLLLLLTAYSYLYDLQRCYYFLFDSSSFINDNFHHHDSVVFVVVAIDVVPCGCFAWHSLYCLNGIP
jgi:hypothetical protein